MQTVLQISAPVLGFFLGTLVFARMGSWLYGIVTAFRSGQHPARKTVPLVAFLHSGPWLLAGVVYWAYYVLTMPHAAAWKWFFGAAAVAIPVYVAVSIYLYLRGRRTRAQAMERKDVA